MAWLSVVFLTARGRLPEIYFHLDLVRRFGFVGNLSALLSTLPFVANLQANDFTFSGAEKSLVLIDSKSNKPYPLEAISERE